MKSFKYMKRSMRASSPVIRCNRTVDSFVVALKREVEKNKFIVFSIYSVFEHFINNKKLTQYALFIHIQNFSFQMYKCQTWYVVAVSAYKGQSRRDSELELKESS